MAVYVHLPTDAGPPSTGGPPPGHSTGYGRGDRSGPAYKIFASGTDLTEAAPHILPEVIERIVDIAPELGGEGREGGGAVAEGLDGNLGALAGPHKCPSDSLHKQYIAPTRPWISYHLCGTRSEFTIAEGLLYPSVTPDKRCV